MDSVSLNILNKDLDGLWERQRAISDNLANFETPGYKAKTVSFENQLRQKLSSGAQTSTELTKEIKGVTPLTEVREDEQFRLDGNGVDMEKENLELARTQINYAYSLRSIGDEFSRLRMAIKGGN